MKPKMISLRAGFTNVYFLVQDRQILLVDTGPRNNEKKILKAITSRGYTPEDIKYIFLTHTHYDHAGSVSALKQATNSKIILQKSEVDTLTEGFTPIPKGTNFFFRIISRLGRMKMVERKIGWFESADADIVFDENLDLKQFGFDAKIIHTPGHTKGSSSLVFDDRAIVGDCMFNLTEKYYPGFANDEPELHQTWKKLSELDVKWYYPSHGRRIAKEMFCKEATFRKIIKRKGDKIILPPSF